MGLKLSLIEEQFDIPVGFQGESLTPISNVTLEFKQTSQSLLNRYVQSESHILVQVGRVTCSQCFIAYIIKQI